MPSAPPPTLDHLLLHAGWLRRMARHLVRDNAAAEDLLQDTWAAALRSPPTTDRPVEPWLAQVLRRFVFMRARGRRRAGRAFESVAHTPEEAPLDPEASLAGVQLQQVVAREVLELDEPFRTTLVLRFYEDLSAADIARRLNVPAGTVRWRLKEALDRLRVRLDVRHGGDRRAWVVALAPLAASGRLAKGALLLSMKQKVVLVVCAALLVGGGGALLLRRARPVVSLDAMPAPSAAVPGLLRVFGGAPQPGEGAQIEGVVRSADGRVVAGAAVTLATRRRPAPAGVPTNVRFVASATAGPDGRFALKDVPAGAMRATAASSGSLSDPVDLTVVEGQSAHLDLVVMPASVFLRGRVEDSGGGPIVAALVRSQTADDVFVDAHSDSRGDYVLALRPGRQRLRVQADGYADGVGQADVPARDRLDFKLQPAARVAGVVVERATGAAVGGATVRARRSADQVWEATSDERGVFVLPRLPDGSLTISAAKGRAVGFLADPLAVTSAGHVDGLVIALDTAYRIAGRVTDDQSRPVADAWIRIEDARRAAGWGFVEGPVMAETDASGRYRIEGVLPGRYTLAARTDDLPVVNQAAVVDTRDADSVDFMLPKAAVVVGHVFDHEGRTVAGADVLVSVKASSARDAVIPANERAKSDAEGAFRVAALPGGAAIVQARHAGHGEVTISDVALEPGATKALTVKFLAPASLAGRVLWEEGGPAARVTVRWQGSDRGSAKTGPDGTFALDPLGASAGVLVAELPDQLVQTSNVDPAAMVRLTLEPGQRRSGLELRLKRPDKTILGVVLDPDGKPAPGLTVGAQPKALRGFGSYQSFVKPATTDEMGRFQIRGLQGQPYTVFCAPDGQPPAAADDVAAGSSNVRLQLIRGATISGVVVTRAGQPVEHFTASVLPFGEAPHSVGDSVEGRRKDIHDPSGAFTLTGLPAGRFDLVVSAANSVGRVANLNLVPGATRADLRVVVGPSLKITGRLIDAQSSAPLVDVAIGVGGRGGHIHARTDAEGRFSIDGFVPGRLTLLSVRPPEGYLGEWLEVAVPEDDATLELPTQGLCKGVPGDRPRDSTTGLGLSTRWGPPTIDSVLPASPAALAGLLPGDRLLTIDGHDVARCGQSGASFFLAGATGTSVDVVAQSPGAAARTVSLSRVARR